MQLKWSEFQDISTSAWTLHYLSIYLCMQVFYFRNLNFFVLFCHCFLLILINIALSCTLKKNLFTFSSFSLTSCTPEQQRYNNFLYLYFLLLFSYFFPDLPSLNKKDNFVLFSHFPLLPPKKRQLPVLFFIFYFLRTFPQIFLPRT